MLYNAPISYSQPGIGYVGSIVIKVPGFSSPILLGDLNLSLTSYRDNSNATTIGVISYNLAPTGILEITATQEQAEAVVSFVNLNSNQQKVAEINLNSNQQKVAEISLVSV